MDQEEQFKRFIKERGLFLRDLKKFKGAAMELANTWEGTGNILHDLTFGGSYPFNEDFAEVVFKIADWCCDLEIKLSNYTQNNEKQGEYSE